MDITTRHGQLIGLLREIGVIQPDQPLEEVVIPDLSLLSDRFEAGGIPPEVRSHIFQDLASFQRDLDELRMMTRVTHPFKTHAERLFAQETGNPFRSSFYSWPDVARAGRDLDQLSGIVSSVPMMRLAGFIGVGILEKLELDLAEFQEYEERREKWGNVILTAELRRLLWHYVEHLEPGKKVSDADNKYQQMAKRAFERASLSPYSPPTIDYLEARGVYLPLVVILVNELRSALGALVLDDRTDEQSKALLMKEMKDLIHLGERVLQIYYLQRPTDPQTLELQRNLDDIARQIRSLEKMTLPEEAYGRREERAKIIGDHFLQSYLPESDWVALMPVDSSSHYAVYSGLFPAGNDEALPASFSSPKAKPLFMGSNTFFLIRAEVEDLVLSMTEGLGSGTWELKVQPGGADPSGPRLIYQFTPSGSQTGLCRFTLDMDSDPQALLFHLESPPTPFLMSEIEGVVYRLNWVDNSLLLKERQRLSFSFESDGENRTVVEFKRIDPKSEYQGWKAQVSIQRVRAVVENFFVKTKEIVEILNESGPWNPGDATRLMALSLDIGRLARFFLYSPGFQPAASSLTDLSRLLLDYSGWAAIKVPAGHFTHPEGRIFSQYPSFVARLEADRREMALGEPYRSRKELRAAGFEKLVYEFSERIGSVVDEEMELLRLTGDQESLQAARKIIKRLPAFALYPVEASLAHRTIEATKVRSGEKSIINFLPDDYFYLSDESTSLLDLEEAEPDVEPDVEAEAYEDLMEVMEEEQSMAYRGVSLESPVTLASRLPLRWAKAF